MAYADRAIAYTLLGEDAAAQRDIARALEMGFDQKLLKDAIERVKSQR